MKNIFFGLALLAFAGCSAYHEVALWNGPTHINDDEVPIASFTTQNFSYQLLGFIPLSTGLPWTEGDELFVDDFNVEFFADKATLDNNLVSLNHALDMVGSHRITQLHSVEIDNADWSLFLVNRHEVRTSCIILAE